jgi:cell volume regulation protein A
MFAYIISTNALIITIAVVMILGYISKAIFRLTKIPEILILMFFGVLLVPIGHLLPQIYTNTLISLAPLFGSIALIVILLGGSKNIHPRSKYNKSALGILLGLFDILLPTIILAYFMNYFFGWKILYGAILGAILGETTTIVVIDIIKRLKIPFSIYDMLVMEATTNSIFSIIAFSIILILITGNALTFNTLSTYTVDYISVGVFFGLLMGFLWLFLLRLIKSAKEYLAILAVALLLYGITALFNGAAIIAVFIFGLIVGNHKTLGKLLKISSDINETEINISEKDIEFLIRTFFFVFIGIIAIISLQYFELAVIITLILILIRYFEIKIFFRKEDKEYWKLAFSLLPRGTTAAILATLLYSLNGIYFNNIFYITFMVILITNIIAGISLTLVSPKLKK